MIFFYQILLIIAQAILLAGIIAVFAFNSRNVFQRFLNPGCWFALFFVMWFWIPQTVTVSYDNFVLGFPQATAESVLRSQIYLVGFLISVLTGMLFVRVSIFVGPGTKTFPSRTLRSTDSLLLWSYYLCGLAATLYLGRSLMTSDGFRSELVKTPIGLAATSVQFFGMFAMAVLGGHAMASRRYFRTFLILGCFGTAIFFTGARGRLLWPIALAIAFTWCRADRIRIGQIAGFLVAGLGLLVVFDPLLIVLREGVRHFSIQQVLEKAELADLFLNKRNFDGFANFTLISIRDLAEHSPKVLLVGGRDTFMTTHFPGTLEGGVGFGTTVPGLMWLAGGLWGLLAGGVGYGMVLGIFGVLMARIRREPLAWSYLFAMTWITALGGNLPESLDKMLVVVSPGFLWWILLPRGERHYEELDVPTGSTQDAAAHRGAHAAERSA